MGMLSGEVTLKKGGPARCGSVPVLQHTTDPQTMTATQICHRGPVNRIRRTDGRRGSYRDPTLRRSLPPSREPCREAAPKSRRNRAAQGPPAVESPRWGPLARGLAAVPGGSTAGSASVAAAEGGLQNSRTGGCGAGRRHALCGRRGRTGEASGCCSPSPVSTTVCPGKLLLVCICGVAHLAEVSFDS